MKKKTYKGFVVVGSYGKIIAMTFDDPKLPPLGRVGFTNEDAKKERDSLKRFEFTA